MSSHWPLVPLGEVLTHRKEFVEINDFETYKRCRVQLHAQGIVLRDRVLGAEIKTKKQQVCRAGEFLVAEIDAKLGGYGIVPKDLEGAIVSSHYFLFGVNEDKLDRSFLGYFIRTPAFFEQVAAQGSTNYAAIRPSHVLEYTMPLPPLAEQRRLVERIDALAGKIEEAKGLREKADQQISVLAFAPYRLIPMPYIEGTKNILADFLEGHDSGWSPQCDEVPSANSEWGVLKTTCVQWEGFQPTQNKALLAGMAPRPDITVREKDVLITRAGPVNRVGVACVVPKSFPKLMLSDKIVRMRTKCGLFPEYLVAFFACPFAQEYFRQGKTGLAESQVNISREKLLRLPIHVPPLDRQITLLKRINAIGERVVKTKSIQAPLTTELDAMLPAILDRAFRGEL
jgi:type I restriction enzyme S subunit